MATLVEVRQNFAVLSGRYELVTDGAGGDWTDNGADLFLQAGQDMLDRLSLIPENEGRIIDTIAADGYYVEFNKRCRFITSVWAASSESRVKLEKVDWDDLHDLYNKPIADVDTGAPLYYCPALLREIDVTDKNATGTFFNYTKSSSADYRGVLIMPPVGEAYDVEVYGKFYQTALTAEDQTNYWTSLHPLTLVKAALYHLETSYRNSEGAKDWMRAIMVDVDQINMDFVEEEVAEIDTMGDKS